MDKSIVLNLLRVCIILLIGFLIILIFRYTYPIIIPILVVFVIAHFMEPGVRFLSEKAYLPRPLASFIVLLFILLVLIGIIILIFTEVYDGIVYLADLLPEGFHQLGLLFDHLFYVTILPIYEQVFQTFHDATSGELSFIREYIYDASQQIASGIGTFLQRLLLAIPSNLALIPESITVLFFILFASFLLSADFPRMKKAYINNVPTRIVVKLEHIFKHLKRSVFGYIKAEFILILITFHFIFFGLVIIGVEHALTIALLMMFVDLVPFLGTGLVFVPWLLYSFLTGNYPLTIGLSIVYGVVIIARQLLEPKIYAVNLAIHPLAWLITAFIGMKVWGVFGLLLAPFTLILLKGLYEAGVFRWILQYIQGKS